MILECEECHSRYLVPDTAIGADGRVVRCANCRHSWFQVPVGYVAPVEATEAPARSPAVAGHDAGDLPDRPAAPTAPEPPVAAPPSAASALPVQEVPPPSPLVDAERPEQDIGDMVAPPRRNTARRTTIAAVAAGIVMLGATGAIMWTGAPGLAAQLGLQLGPAETPLKFAAEKLDRRDLPTGSELFAVSGRVVNPTTERQHVPDIRVDLRDAHQRPVYSWTVTPPQRSIPPGGAVEFNSAKLDVPKNAHDWTLSFAGEPGK